MTADELLAALDPQQREVAEALTGPVRVLAGAGTGKTRAITHRIAYGVRTGVYRPDSVLAVTFTARAAGEMRARLAALGVEGVQARTFHSAALRQLSYFWPRAVGGPPPRLIDHKAKLVASAAQQLGLEVDRISVRDLAAEIEWVKTSLLEADDYVTQSQAAGRSGPTGFAPQEIAQLIRAYEDTKDAAGFIDFEDVLLLLGGILQENAVIAEEVHRQYRRFVDDEFQDVSPLQNFLLNQWLGGRQELCVVGDPSQTIYSFSGASSRYLLEFAKKYPKAKRIELIRDYRSSPQIVKLANQLLSQPVHDDDYPALELKSQRPAGPPPVIAAYGDDEAEAQQVVQQIKRLIAAGVNPGEIAILYRTNAQSAVFEAELAAQQLSYQVRGSENFFAKPQVREAIAVLRVEALSGITELPLEHQVPKTLEDLGFDIAKPPRAAGAQREKWEYLKTLCEMAEQFASTAPNLKLKDFVTELAHREQTNQVPATGGVTLASLHAAKGLEWDAVFLTGISDGLLPISWAVHPEAYSEERRLLYVGITRAREHLAISWAKSRHPGGAQNRKISPFLLKLQESPRSRNKFH